MRRLIEIATERRVTIVMFTVAIVLFGMVSLSRLKVNLLPDISYPTVTVRTELTGAAPAEIENLLTKPIEEAVGVIRNVRLVRSVSRSGQSDVTLEFLWGTDMDIALRFPPASMISEGDERFQVSRECVPDLLKVLILEKPLPGIVLL